MPNIVQYDSPVTGLQPSEVGVEATAQAGRYIGKFYNQWGEALRDFGNRTGSELGRSVADAGNVAVDYLDHKQISAGAAHGTSMLANLTDSWNKIVSDPNTDPNDPAIAEKFRTEQLEPALEKFKEGFWTEKGQAWAEHFVDGLRSHMFEKTAADMSTLAGVALHQNVKQLANAASNTAMSDPSSVPFLLDNADHSITGIAASSPTLKGVAAAQARTQLTEQTKEMIVKSGAIGAIQKSSDPEGTAEEWGQRYPQYISGDELKMLSANARQQIRARNYDFEQNRRRQKEITDDRSNEASNQYLMDIRSQDPKLANDPTAVKVLNDPNLNRKDKNNLLNYIDRQAKPETEQRISSQTSVDLLRQFRANPYDADKLMDAAWEARLKDPGKPGSLTERDFNAFRNEVAALKTPEGEALASDRKRFMTQFDKTIDGGFSDKGGPSMLGTQNLYQFEMDARRREGELRQKGINPHELYDPHSPNYFGTPENLAKYRVSLAEATRYEATLKSMDKSIDQVNTNLNAPGTTITGTQVITVPPGMSPAEAMKKFPGQTVRLPDGRMKTLPTAAPEQRPAVPQSR